MTDAHSGHADPDLLRELGAVLRLDQRLVHVVEWFAEADVDALVLKGAALAHLDHDDPSDRIYGDVDLLVRDDDLVPACRLLSARGYERREPPLSSLVDRRFIKSITMVAPDGIELDLHRTLAYGTWGLVIDTEELWSAAVDFELAGRPLRTLDREHRFLHACLHAALANTPPTKSLRDIAVLLARQELDHDVVAQRTAHWQLQPIVARAIALAEERLGSVADVPTVKRFADHEPTPHQQRAIRAYTDPGVGHVEKVLASLPFLKGWWHRTVFLVSALIPSPRRLAAQGGLRAVSRRAAQALARIRRSRH